MKITVKGFHQFQKAMGNQALLKMEVENSTIKEVLYNLSNRFGKEFKNLLLDPETGQTQKKVVILLNGVAHTYHLDTLLKDGDVIALFPVVSGG